MVNPVIPHREATQLIETIETAVVTSTAAAARLQAWASSPKGNYIPDYLVFYEAFTILFTLTSNLEEMKSEQETIDRIRGWVVPVVMGSSRGLPKRVEAGIELHGEYLKILNQRGILSLRK